MNRIWKIKDSNPQLQTTLANSLKISPIVAQLLLNRGIEDERAAYDFLYGELDSCYDPHLLKDMDKSVARIRRAIREKEHIFLYGDYDVDGITAVGLLSRVFAYLKANVTTYIPNRLEEGYGLNSEAVRLAHRKKVSLILTVDCGISAHKEIELANSLNIDVIVTDHHEIKEGSLPKAYSIINPLREGCGYPFKHLTGVGLAYKLAQALLEGSPFALEEHLDLVALGTVSDLAVQKGENRILTKNGLKKLSSTKKAGIKALIEVSGLEGKDINCGHIGYILGPRINAMGRVGSPEVALRLLLTDDADEARRLAETLNRENRNRQKIESQVLGEAMEKIKREINFKDLRVIVLSSPNWHVGVIGIVASRITDKFYRPTIMIALEGNIGRGSGRSIDGFHMFDTINSCRELLLDFGGHEGACGLSIEKGNIDRFRDKINKLAKEQIRDEDLCPTLNIDVEVSLSDLTERLVEELELLAPFGPENPRPIFSSSNVYLKNEPKRITRGGLKMWVTDNRITCEAITFRAEGMSMPYKGSMVDLVYSPSINTWQGLSSLQLDLRDLKVIL
ncbi:MAG: single-stranded-DNA-specific exonuclease RecJ [Omnitrophica bacterium RBG_13_46_9]|nr:MAG: single-stranded-DNA-specific exonuclease RecJ [Omnitrophica bacterium RBG_13_46_9]